MSDKEKIRAEIERRLDDLYEKLPDGNNVMHTVMTTADANITGKYTALESLLSFIDSMGEEVKANKYILITQEILDYINKHLIFFENDMPNIGDKWYVEKVVTYPTACEGKPVVEVINDEKGWMRLPKDIVVIQEEPNAKFKVGDTVRRKRDGLEAEVIDVCNGIATVRCENWDDTIIDKEIEQHSKGH